MGFAFDLDHSIQLIAHIFERFHSDRMNIMKLLKLLYIADRESLRKAGYPLTGDAPYAMPHGPVLSQIYDLMKTDNNWSSMTGDGEESRWCEYFIKEAHDLRMIKTPGSGELSGHDKDTLAEVCTTYGDWDQFQLSQYSHEFIEWKRNESGHSSRPIPLRDLIEAVGRVEDLEEIEQIRAEEQYFIHMFNGYSF